jgi:hypothetical protein
MKLVKTAFAVFFLAIVAPSWARAQESRVQPLTPFIDDQTIAIVRVDALRLDQVKIKQVANSLAADFDLKGNPAAWLSWQSAFLKAGGQELYLVFSMATIPADPCFAIAPVPAGADVQGIKAALGEMPYFKNAVRESMDSAVFAGSKEALERIKRSKPTVRKEIAAALEAGRQSAVQVVIVPTADNRRVIEEITPTLPELFGGGSIKVLTRGIQWASISLGAPPAITLHAVVESESAEAAQQLARLIKLNVARIAKLPSAEKMFPGLGALASDLIPTVTGNRLTLSLDENKVMTFLKPSARMIRDKECFVRNNTNLRDLVFALHSYYDANKQFPAVANFDKGGKPLLSWRVHILPFLGEAKLYKEFHLDEPWDSEHNKALIAKMPAVYQVPGTPGLERGMTTYLAPVGKESMWTGKPKAFKLADATDGTSNTVFIVDAADKLATPWTKPSDFAYDPKNIAVGLAYRFFGKTSLAYVDGSVRALSTNIDANKLLAIFTRNGGEVVDW